jgi:hypothetical protein|tara:strand:- start:2627 stop:2815 length:189 start_codon:yes stop_codon:yes gene_type:complete
MDLKKSLKMSTGSFGASGKSVLANFSRGCEIYKLRGGKKAGFGAALIGHEQSSQFATVKIFC